VIGVTGARNVSIRSSNRSSRAQAIGGVIDASNAIDRVTAGASVGGGDVDGEGPLPPAGVASPASASGGESGALAAENGPLDALGPARTDGSIQRAPLVDTGSRGSLDSAVDAAPPSVSHDGDNRFVWSQRGSIDGGDALAGASVIGVLATGRTNIDASNHSFEDTALIGRILLDQKLTRVRVGSRVGSLGPVGRPNDGATIATSEPTLGPLGALGPGSLATRTDALGTLGPVGPGGTVTFVAIQQAGVSPGGPPTL
jgi:hypothetical protein